MGAETQVRRKRSPCVTFLLRFFTRIGIAQLLLSHVEYQKNAPDGLASATVHHIRTDMTFTKVYILCFVKYA